MGAAASVSGPPAAAAAAAGGPSPLDAVRSALISEVGEADVPETVATEMKDIYEAVLKQKGKDQAYATLKKMYIEFRENDPSLQKNELKCGLRQLPDAIDNAVNVYGKWPLIIDPEGQASRYMRYQAGAFLVAAIPKSLPADRLRVALRDALKRGSFLTLFFSGKSPDLISELFQDGIFPKAVIQKEEIFKEEVFGTILTGADDPSPDLFFPSSNFKLVLITEQTTVSEAMQHKFCLIRVGGKKPTPSGDQDQEEASTAEVASLLGYKEIKRNSTDLVDAGFDGELDEIKTLLEKGFYLESVDGHDHTALSEASCKGHNGVVRFLLEQGADPNKVNDKGRSPLFRAAFNNMNDTVKILLESGGDPDIKTLDGGEGPFDVAGSEELQQMIKDWDRKKTVRLMEQRKQKIRKEQEARIRNSVEREMLAKTRLREEAMEMVEGGDAEGLKALLVESAEDAVASDVRPRLLASARDQRGNTLFAVAVWKNQFEVAQMLIEEHKRLRAVDSTSALGMLEDDEQKMMRRVFAVNVNTKDQKGWTPTCIAAFHGHKVMLEFLLKNGGKPELRNSYNKDAYDMAKLSRTGTVAVRWYDQKLKAEDEATNATKVTECEAVLNKHRAEVLAAKKKAVGVVEKDMTVNEYGEGMAAAASTKKGKKKKGKKGAAKGGKKKGGGKKKKKKK